MSLIRMFSDGPDVIFERVADGIAHDSRFVRVGAFAAKLSGFDIFFALSHAAAVEFAIEIASITPEISEPISTPASIFAEE